MGLDGWCGRVQHLRVRLVGQRGRAGVHRVCARRAECVTGLNWPLHLHPTAYTNSDNVCYGDSYK